MTLPQPTERTSVETLSRGAAGLGFDGEQMVILPVKERYATIARFRPQGKTREDVFGRLSDMGRPTILKPFEIGHLINIFRSGEQWLGFDGTQFGFTVFSPSWTELFRRSIPWDKVRPPRDRGGEATRIETNQLRTQFSQEWIKSNGSKAYGISPAPLKIRGSLAPTYLVLLGLPSYLIGLLECQKDEPSQCQLTRACDFVGPKIAPDERKGIATSTKRDLILVGDSSKNKIYGYDFNTCFHSEHVRSWIIPQKLKTITNLYIDQDDGL